MDRFRGLKTVDGDLIKLAREWRFDVIAHGCNCFCKQASGLAPQMVKAFGTDKSILEENRYIGDINKLGQIELVIYIINKKGTALVLRTNSGDATRDPEFNSFAVVNMYTQYRYGINHPDGQYTPFDYEAFTLCCRKLANKFKGKRVGLPWVGAGLAGGDKNKIADILKKELDPYVDLTMVNYKI